jgi:hypothetical protein
MSHTLSISALFLNSEDGSIRSNKRWSFIKKRLAKVLIGFARMTVEQRDRDADENKDLDLFNSLTTQFTSPRRQLLEKQNNRRRKWKN